MVIYELQCPLSHRFEGWFKDAQSYKNQSNSGLIQCTICGCDQVTQVPAGCHISGKKASQPITTKDVEINKPADSTKPLPQNIDPITFLKSMQNYVKENFKNVGSDFTNQAVQMQRGELPVESIYGTADHKQIDRLDEEGVSYYPLPKLPKCFDN